MKLAVLAFAALASIVAAQDQYYNVSSPNFRLIIKSDNATLNDTALGACHQGAAIEGLCLTGEKVSDPASLYTTFYHNVSASTNVSDFDTVGLLGYNLWSGGNIIAPSAMQLSISPTSNVANAIFLPGWYAPSIVLFEASGSMYINVYQNDLVDPITYFEPPLRAKNWYICATKWAYSYETLIWRVSLVGQPQNPACQWVDIVRVFV
ncbi:hypothetical protein HBI75_004900 [Parastagonospora nodorum]|nr:hypothetical protein HBI75_004900 [Parastagonospora nodorum]